MHTWIALALVGSTASANIPEGLTWQKDYNAAKLQAKEAQKPLAVFIGTGTDGWTTLIREGSSDPTVNRVLMENYVCVYADRSTPAGQRLAEVFEVANGTGLVISDKTGSVQAYHHSGLLARADLTRTLERYADPDRLVYATETLTEGRYSTTAAPQQLTPARYQAPAVVLPYRSIGGG